MKKNKSVIPYISLALLTFFLCWFFVGRYGIFGSQVDWMAQHSVFPDYFRQQFYATGKLIPEFAPNIGGGQNIYNFAYYGLLSPLILPSYLLPFVKMGTYMMAVTILALTASVLLLYKWLGNHGFSFEIRFGVSMLFLLAGPMIFQSYRQIMFVDYMPFLILALFGMDAFFAKGKTLLFTVSVFLMIMTSFYYSIGGMLVLLIYGLSALPEAEHKLTSLLRLGLSGLAAILTSGFLVVPTLSAILVRSGGSAGIDWKSLFIPHISPWTYIYSGYGIGLSLAIVPVLIYEFFRGKRKEQIMTVLCVTVFSVPVFSLLLNGGLYSRNKVFIPFIPMLCYLTACFFRSLKDVKRLQRFRKLLTPVLLAPLLLYLVTAGLRLNQTDGQSVQPNFAKSVWDTEWKKSIDQTLSQDSSFYRLEQDGNHEERKVNMNRIWNSRQWTTSICSSAYNQDYQTFLREVFQLEVEYSNGTSHPASYNPLFRRLMGVKYLMKRDRNGEISAKEASLHPAPVIYATDTVLAEEAYRELSFPYNQTALMQYAVAKLPASSSAVPDKIKDSAAPVEFSIPENSAVKKEGDHYHIQTNQTLNTALLLPKNQVAGKRILFLQFDITNNTPESTFFIRVNGVRNHLSSINHPYYNGNHTFTFTTELKDGQWKVPVNFSRGDYTLSEIHCYLGDAASLDDDALYRHAFQPDWEQTRGKQICGTLAADKDSYAVTSIPFDEGFRVIVDGQDVETEKVNTAFLGFPVSSGDHKIVILYHAPGVDVGRMMTLIGVVLWLASIVIERRLLRRSALC